MGIFTNIGKKTNLRWRLPIHGGRPVGVADVAQAPRP